MDIQPNSDDTIKVIKDIPKKKKKKKAKVVEKKAKVVEKKATTIEELRNMLRAKIGEKCIMRGSKQHKENVLEKTLKQIGIDKNKFKSDIEAVKNQGGFTLNMKQ